MRIAHVTDCYLPRLGGIELQVHDLAHRQAEDHDVTVVTTTVESSSAGLTAPGRVKVVRLASPGRDAEAIRYRRANRGPRTVLRGDFDLVHVHASSFSPLAFLAARSAARRGVPTVATVHSLWAKATPLFSAADTLVEWADWPIVWSAVSNSAASSLRRILAGRAEVTILPNGVDAAEWCVAHEGPSAGEVRIAVVSRLASRKRVLQLMRVLEAARARLPDNQALTVEVIGDGPERAKLERYLSRHGMRSWVTLRGRCQRSEIRSVFARSDLFVAPAVLESFGIAALEARCGGLPVLARSGTGVEDFVAHGSEGWLVDSDRAMTDTIVVLARSPELLHKVGAHNRAVSPRISWPEVLRRCDVLYRQAALLHERPVAGVEASSAARRVPAESGG